LWLAERSLTLEHQGQALARYDVVAAAREPVSGAGGLREISGARLFETPFSGGSQPRLFALEEAGWLKAVRLSDYAPRRPAQPPFLQDALFPYAAAAP